MLCAALRKHLRLVPLATSATMALILAEVKWLGYDTPDLSCAPPRCAGKLSSHARLLQIPESGREGPPDFECP